MYKHIQKVKYNNDTIKVHFLQDCDHLITKHFYILLVIVRESVYKNIK